MLMPFGKYKGRSLSLVPESYLSWILENTKPKPTIRRAIEQQLGIRNMLPTAPVDPSAAFLRTLSAWHKANCLRWHPDRPGGDSRVMAALNDAVDRLQKALKGRQK